MGMDKGIKGGDGVIEKALVVDIDSIDDDNTIKLTRNMNMV